MGRLVRVQVPSLAPKNNNHHLVIVIFLCYEMYDLNRLVWGSPQSPLDFVGRGKIDAVFVILLLAKEFEHGIYLDESPVSRTKKTAITIW